MQFTHSQINEQEQIICSFFVTRGGTWQSTFEGTGGAFLPDAGKNMLGLTASLAVYPADFEKGFGIDVVITDGIRGQPEDITFPVGVLLDNHIIGRDPLVNFWARFLIYGPCDRVWAAGGGNNQVMLGMTSINSNGGLANFSLGEYISRRKLTGTGAFTAGTMKMDSSFGTWDWTNTEDRPTYNSTILSGLGLGNGGIVSALSSIVGYCPREDPVFPPDAPITGNTSRRGFIMLLNTSAGRV